MTSEDWAYLAGIIDGEGCISCHGGTRNSGKHTVSIRVSQRVKGFTPWLENNFGGKVCRVVREDPKRSGVSYRWQVYGKDNIEHILKGVLPYLKLKKDQAEVALEIIALMRQTKPGHKHSGRVAYLALTLKDLKQEGKEVK